MTRITCRMDDEGGAEIIDDDGVYYYADASEMHTIRQANENGASPQGALRRWIDSQNEQEAEE